MRLSQKLALHYVGAIRLLRLKIILILSRLLFKHNNSCNNILINRDGAFGDSVVAIPAISIIRQNFPNANIDLLSINDNGVSFKDLSLSPSLVNNIFTVEKKQRKALLKELKKTNYDLFIQLPQNIGIYKTIRNILLVRFYLNICNGFGWDSGRVKSFMSLQKKYSIIPTETERFINTLKQNNLTGNIEYPLETKKPKESVIQEKLLSTKPIVFLIGGKLQPKKWPLDNWVSLAKLIGQQNNILILGGKDETEEAKYIVAKTENTRSFCGELTIPELLYVLTKASVAISLDTGAMHLCDAAGTKTIALFSTRDLSNKWWPNNKNSIVIEKVLPCSFCLKSVCVDNICMKNIEPKEVFSALYENL